MLIFKCDLCGKEVVLSSKFLSDMYSSARNDGDCCQGESHAWNKVYKTFRLNISGVYKNSAHTCIDGCANDYVTLIEESKKECGKELSEIINKKIEAYKIK